MISYLAGNVVKHLPSGAIVSVGGVGYQVSLTLPTIASLGKIGKEVELWVYTVVREDALSLFAFEHWDERQTFELLIKISGVGPKVAMAILSTLPVNRLRHAVEKKESSLFELVPGIGKRTAEKICLELQAKLEKLFHHSDFLSGATVAKVQVESVDSLGASLLVPERSDSSNSSEDSHWQGDLQSALENLGFKNRDISLVLRKLARSYKGEPFTVLVKEALKLVTKKNAEIAKDKSDPLEKSN